MHLTCPSCSATFKAEAEAFDHGARRLRCGRCGHVWREAPPLARAPAAAPQPRQATLQESRPGAAPEPDPYSAPPQRDAVRRRERPRDESLGHEPYPKRSPRGGGSAFGWIVFLAVIAALVFSAWHFRDKIVAEVPETAEIYRALNIPIQSLGEGLEITGVTSVRRTVGGERRIVVSGSIVNVSGGTRTLPLLRAVVSNAAGREVLSWEFAAAARSLAPGDVASFETSAANPPEESALRVEFAGPR